MQRLRAILGWFVVLGAVLMFGAAGTGLPEAIENILFNGDFHLFGAIIFNFVLWVGVAYVGFKIIGDN